VKPTIPRRRQAENPRPARQIGLGGKNCPVVVENCFFHGILDERAQGTPGQSGRLLQGDASNPMFHSLPAYPSARPSLSNRLATAARFRRSTRRKKARVADVLEG